MSGIPTRVEKLIVGRERLPLSSFEPQGYQTAELYPFTVYQGWNFPFSQLNWISNFLLNRIGISKDEQILESISQSTQIEEIKALGAQLSQSMSNLKTQIEKLSTKEDIEKLQEYILAFQPLQIGGKLNRVSEQLEQLIAKQPPDVSRIETLEQKLSDLTKIVQEIKDAIVPKPPPMQVPQRRT